MPARNLDLYREKRDPARTPEPLGGEKRLAPAAAAHSYVIQQHAARRMHWDLRLEIEGVLVSFAVPRGPQIDPSLKHLAVQTEDHPIEYADFEGIIPAGNYGAGAMIVWDRGTYTIVDGQTPSEGLASGKLDIRFSGHKLHGRWALVRTKGGEAPPGKGWLLLRKGPPKPADELELVEAMPASVLSGLTIDELRDGVRRTDAVRAMADAAGARERAIDPSKVSPMLAETADVPFSRDGWIFEQKLDGVRVLASRDASGRVRQWSRRGRETTNVYPEITRAVAHLPVDDFVIDGEIVAIDDLGRTSFERLQRRFTQSDPREIARMELEIPVVLYAFDVLSVAGRDLTDVPLTARKEILAAFAPRLGYVRYTDHIEREGKALFDAAKDAGLEGVVGKRAASKYVPGQRTRDWQKMKVPRGADLAVVGWMDGKGSRKDIGSLMTAWKDDGRLVYAGNVGSGLDEATRKSLVTLFESSARDAPAFEGLPEPPPKGCHFVEPMLVAEVRFTEVTEMGLLRQPVFVRFRDDKKIEEVDARPKREAAREVAATRSDAPPPPPPELKLSNLDKVFWPDEGYTKGDLLRYYETIWPWLAPYLRDRPLVLTRYPDGIDGKSFYQKNAPDWTPEWVETFHIDDTDFFICNDPKSLLHVINSGAIPLHVWSARRGSLDRPDWTILDLDPKGAPFADVVHLAKEIHDLLGELDAPHYIKTSGQDGLHILVPLGRALDHHEAKTLAEVIAKLVCAKNPDISTVARRPDSRGGKVYIDFLQNGFGKLIAGPYSVRPRKDAPVSMPITWREVGPKLDPSKFNITNAAARMKKKGDPMLAVLETKADVPRLLAALVERLERELS